ncbi:MAG TPA: presqualene diphosphate synthase HpnD [Blastocatellia bacterium]|nr:presqualene diphosphate synthase HpnD [Blastocatellia bacterium]
MTIDDIATASRLPSEQKRFDHSAGSTFYYSFLLLPSAKRKAIKTIYGLCRILDDIVDQERPGGDPAAELQHWRDEIESCYQGYPSTPFGEQLLDTIEEFEIPRQPFIDLIDGMEMDLQWQSYQTFADLREYCYRVASAVGLICIEIFGYDSLRTREYAVNLGLALQLTNIMRDLKEDIARGRIYIPIEDLERFGYSEQDLKNNLYNAPFIQLMRYEHARALSYFERAAASLPEGDRASMFAAEIMGKIYRELLDNIAAAQFDVYRNRITVPKARRLKIALRTWLDSKFKR